MQPVDPPRPRAPSGAAWVCAALLTLWLAASFGVAFFARDLQQMTARGWPLHFWLLAQGGVLVFIGIVAAYAWYMNRADRAQEAAPTAQDDER